MSHTSGTPAPAPKPTPPPAITQEEAYKHGAHVAKMNLHPSYAAAAEEFLAKHGHRQLIAFESGYFDGSNGWA